MEIQQEIGFQLGMLSVRYLGVPFVTRRLTDRDWKLLVEKMIAKINHWATKFLSYAGCLQLIQSVLYSIQNFWCTQFFLPKSVFKRLNQLCSNFFWKGSSDSKRGARVKWQEVCHSKDEGGLGLKDILSWNQASMIQHLWSIFSKLGSIWIAWIHAYELKGRNIWQASMFASCSWSWKKILQLRSLARQFVV